MTQEPHPTEEDSSSARPHGAVRFASFLVPLLFVWLVFDNLALGILAGLLFGGGSEAVQRAGQKKDSD